MVVAFLMAAEVVMFFPRVVVVKLGAIAATAPGIRRVAINRIIRITVAVSWRAPTSAIASAENAGAYDQYDERLN
jgi:hypothetical protein